MKTKYGFVTSAGDIGELWDTSKVVALDRLKVKYPGQTFQLFPGMTMEQVAEHVKVQTQQPTDFVWKLIQNVARYMAMVLDEYRVDYTDKTVRFQFYGDNGTSQLVMLAGALEGIGITIKTEIAYGYLYIERDQQGK